ncbi:MAG TPA: hypothetical protein VFW04_04490 [Gemmatimonadaceae bacterium]|nr:hypothetical protein [Gemmatimonadaceae bacterium]
MQTACVMSLAILVVACQRAGDASAHAARAPSAAALSPADSAALARDAWSVPEIIRRVREAGLGLTDSGETVRQPGLHQTGHVLHLGQGTLTVFIYPGRGARVRDAAGLDTTLHGMPTLDTPHYILSGNLIAILVTPNDATVERVTNALTARHTRGPP